MRVRRDFDGRGSAAWHLPYSFFEPDPHPLVTLWGGPILGVMIPVAIAFFIRTKWIWFIAYFCVLANGSYIATAWVSGDRFLDTPKMLEHGAHPISILYTAYSQSDSVTLVFAALRSRAP